MKETKFLGLIWDSKLTIEPHIIYHKAWCQNRWISSVLIEILYWNYIFLVRSKFDYGCMIYGSVSKTPLARLDLLHNQCLRCRLGSISLFTGWKLVCWSPWTSIINSYREVISAIYRPTKSQPRESSLWICAFLLDTEPLWHRGKWKSRPASKRDPWPWHRPTCKCPPCRFEAIGQLLYPAAGSNQVGCGCTW